MAKYDEFGGEIVEDGGAEVDEFGGEVVKPSAPAPAQAAQASISQAFGTTPSSGPSLGEKALQTFADFGSGVVSGIPFGLGPTLVGALPGTSEEEVRQTLEGSRKRSPVAFGAGEFGAEVPTFLTGAGLGSKLAEKAAPALARSALGPGLRKAVEAMYKGVGLGTVTGGEAAGRALVEGGDARDVAKAGVETGVANLLMPLGFEAAPILARKAPSVVRGLASTVAPAALAVESAPFEREKGEILPTLKGDATDLTKWALTQGLLAGGVAGEGFEKLAAKSRESIQPKLRRATAEGMELAREDVFKDVIADETVRNQQFRAAIKGEQRAIRTADQIRQGDVKALDKLEADVRDADALARGLEEGTDPSLRGLLGKLFQDVSNRLLRAKQALANRPELAGTPVAEKIATVDRLIEESYLKNTERGGYLEDFNDDPYVRLEQIRKERAADAARKRDRLAGEQAALLERMGMRNYLEEARVKTAPPPVPEARQRELAEAAGLEYAGPDTSFGKPVRHRLAMSPERRAELDAQTQAEFERQVAAGGRVLRGLAPEAEYGEKPKFMNVMDVGRIRAATQPLLPDIVQPNVAFRAATGPVRALTRAPESEFRSTQAIREERRPAETTMEKPFSTVAMLRAWDKVLERPSEKTMGTLARIADRLGITYDKLLKTTAYRSAALEQALKDPEVAKEVMANVQAP